MRMAAFYIVFSIGTADFLTSLLLLVNGSHIYIYFFRVGLNSDLRTCFVSTRNIPGRLWFTCPVFCFFFPCAFVTADGFFLRPRKTSYPVPD